MPDAIFIEQQRTLGFGGTVIDRYAESFVVHLCRIHSQEELDVLVQGGSLKDVPKESIHEFKELPPPDGAPLPEFSDGHPVISSFDEALEVAKAALQNPESFAGLLEFDRATPIYFAMPGQRAEVFHVDED